MCLIVFIFLIRGLRFTLDKNAHDLIIHIMQELYSKLYGSYYYRESVVYHHAGTSYTVSYMVAITIGRV